MKVVVFLRERKQGAGQTEQVSTSQATASWTVTFENGEQRVFNGLNGSINGVYYSALTGGPLAAIIDRNGNTTTLTYTALNPGSQIVDYILTTVTDPAGRNLNFTYGSNISNALVTGVTSDPGRGINVTYTYGTVLYLEGTSLPVLTQVTQADNTFVTFTYEPLAFGITSVNDTNGKVLESHTYPSSTCTAGLSSSRANGVDALTVTYFPNFLYYCSFEGVGTP